LLILGAREYAPVFADSFEGVGEYIIVGFVENLDERLCDQTILDLPVYWLNDLRSLNDSHWAICCLGTTHRAGFVEAVQSLGIPFGTLVHRTSAISRRCCLGEGTSIDAGAVVAAFSALESHVRVGRGATIGHHIQIRQYSTIHPGVNIASRCEVGPKAIIGIG